MPAEAAPRLQPGDALLIVDVQRDFCAGGKLALAGGDEVVPVLNRWIEEAERAGAAVFASLDRHPAGHCSFREEGGEWPEHCVEGTPGAELHPDLRLPERAERVTKGDHRDFDQYSAFDRTGLAERLRELGVRRVWIGGLALDVCVRASAIDGVRAGFEVHVLPAATRAVDPSSAREAIVSMRREGVVLEDGDGGDG